MTLCQVFVSESGGDMKRLGVIALMGLAVAFIASLVVFILLTAVSFPGMWRLHS
jgi:hypothetical protein